MSFYAAWAADILGVGRRYSVGFNLGWGDIEIPVGFFLGGAHRDLLCGGGVELLLVRQFFSPYFFISFGILVCIRLCRSCTLAFRLCIRLCLCILVCTFERPCHIFELLCHTFERLGHIFALPCRTFERLCHIFVLPCRTFGRLGRIFALLGRTFRQRFYILCLLFHIFGQHKFASYIAVWRWSVHKQLLRSSEQIGRAHV